METILDQLGRTLTLRAYLPLEEGTNLQDYQLEINPYHDMSFTGKFLEPELFDSIDNSVIIFCMRDDT